MFLYLGSRGRMNPTAWMVMVESSMVAPHGWTTPSPREIRPLPRLKGSLLSSWGILQLDIILGFANFLSVREGTLKPVSPSGFRLEGQQNSQRARLSKTLFKVVSKIKAVVRLSSTDLPPRAVPPTKLDPGPFKVPFKGLEPEFGI